MKAYVILVVGMLISGTVAYLLPRAGGKPVNVTCQTTKGPIDVVVRPDWAPLGAERFLLMVDAGYYNGVPLFRCIDNFLCQFGPRPGGSMYAAFHDDPPRAELRKFRRGYVSFAGHSKDSRSTHVFITLSEAPLLGTQAWETPFAFVKPESMAATVAHFDTSYGDKGPDGVRIEAADGEAYVKRDFPKIDWITSCKRSSVH